MMSDRFLPLTVSMDNVHASRVGEACDRVAKSSRGDLIDVGLAAVTFFEEAGYYIIPKNGNKDFFTGHHRPPARAALKGQP
jgi:hypothetical protein